MKQLLGYSLVYRLMCKTTGLDILRRNWLRQYVPMKAGSRILDLGCGTADVLSDISADVSYTGIDSNTSYIRYARERWGNRARFELADITKGVRGVLGSSQYDIVILFGVYHHLDDKSVVGVARSAKEMLAATGCAVSLDGAYTGSTSRVARWFLDNDRGRYVRTPDEYVRLLRNVFGDVRAYSDCAGMRIPYTVCVLRGAS